MLNKIKIYTTIISIVFVSTLFVSQASFAQPYNCLPTCSVIDAKFMALSGVGVTTINNTDAFFQFISLTKSPLEIGIFDGDATTSWDIDNAPFTVLDFRLFADPNGDGTGTILVAHWSSDGTFGDNVGDPMPDNDWFTRTIINIPAARTQNGTYSYRMQVTNINPQISSINLFKVRTDGIVEIPAGEAFNFFSNLRTPEDVTIVYPNFDGGDPGCVGGMFPGGFCDRLTDPSCCFNPSNYDGIWIFAFKVPPGVDTLDVWDGDFDFGSQSFNANGVCIDPDGVSVDTDDPNTPTPLPPWAIGTETVIQGVSSPADPADDFGCGPPFHYPPSISYDIIDPNGIVYTNTNTSGDREWELFNLSTKPFDPSLYDIHVSEIPAGLWTLRAFGVDLSNFNSFRLPYTMCSLDEQNNIVCAPDIPERNIPTLNEWGLILMAAILGILGLFAIKRRQVTA